MWGKKREEKEREEKRCKAKQEFDNAVAICLQCVHCVQYEYIYDESDPLVVKCGNKKMDLAPIHDWRGWHFKILKCSEYKKKGDEVMG